MFGEIKVKMFAFDSGLKGPLKAVISSQSVRKICSSTGQTMRIPQSLQSGAASEGSVSATYGPPHRM